MFLEGSFLGILPQMPVPTYTVTCTKNVLIVRDVYEFALSKPPGFIFEPGQYVLFDVPLVGDPADIQPRAFSLAALPEEPDLLFIAKLVPGGRMSRFVAESLSAGTTILMKGPMGRFVLDRTTDNRLLFVATGTGIAPFRPQILALLAADPLRRIDLIFGVRTEQDLFWMDMFRDLERKHPNVHFHPTLSAGSSSWGGHRGRVQAVIPQIVTDFSRLSLYACGNPEMTKGVKHLALTQWGMGKEDVHVEGYI
ncbi:MAG: CDP-4-dehydro-6-deoxyglucose reductase [Candidatus Peregrinibacteria bacterium Greene0416_19]|nr:MAG: CDP-4-dehydro-6-deoxyglucose reductase [Candidatus Peregrinibacteria bacterium Greene0416_19]